MIYILAINTGFRAEEIASLRWDSFDFSKGAQSVTIEAGYSKRRRRDVQPLRADIASLFSDWKALRGDDSAVLVFPIKPHIRWADMIRDDLIEAGIDPVDAAGRSVDFHALRHTFITNLVKGGILPKVAQGLARHSKITLTMDVYTHLPLSDQKAALDVLPAVHQAGDDSQSEKAELKKTGTDGGGVDLDSKKLTLKLTGTDFRDSPKCPKMAQGEEGTGNGIHAIDDYHKSINTCMLGTKKESLSAFDTDKLHRGRRGSNPQPSDRQSDALTN